MRFGIDNDDINSNTITRSSNNSMEVFDDACKYKNYRAKLFVILQIFGLVLGYEVIL